MPRAAPAGARRHLVGVHWIFATIPAICDDLHQAFVVAKGAAPTLLLDPPTIAGF